MIDGADTEAIWGALKLALLYDARWTEADEMTRRKGETTGR